MNYRIKGVLGTVLGLALLLADCSAPAADANAGKNHPLNAVTTTMLADLAAVIGGDRVAVAGLMGRA